MKLLEKIKPLFKEKRRIVLIVCAALVGAILVGASFIGKGENKEIQESKTLEEYKKELEGELEAACSMVRGVGRCEVIVTFSRGVENTYRGTVLVESRPPEVMGVSVICEGADSDEVRASVTDMMATLFGIGKNRISVMKLGK